MTSRDPNSFPDRNDFILISELVSRGKESFEEELESPGKVTHKGLQFNSWRKALREHIEHLKTLQATAIAEETMKAYQGMLEKQEKILYAAECVQIWYPQVNRKCVSTTLTYKYKDPFALVRSKQLQQFAKERLHLLDPETKMLIEDYDPFSPPELKPVETPKAQPSEPQYTRGNAPGDGVGFEPDEPINFFELMRKQRENTDDPSSASSTE